MPTYDYECEAGHTFDAQRPIDRRNDPLPCPTCGAPTKRVFRKAPVLGWSPASADGGRPHYTERVKREYRQP